MNSGAQSRVEKAQVQHTFVTKSSDLKHNPVAHAVEMA